MPISIRHRALALALLLVPGAGAAAQDREYGPLVVRLAGGTRALALANAAVASRDDEAIFYNPAQLLVQRGIAGSYESFGQGSLYTLASAQTSGSLGLGIGVRFVEFTALTGGTFPIDPRWLQGNILGARGTSTALDVGLARTVKGVRAGVGLAYVENRVADTRLRHVVTNFGAAVGGQLSAGIALQNLAIGTPAGSDALVLDGSGRPLRAERLPTTLTAGVNGNGYPVGPFDLSGGAAVGVRRDGRVLPRLGVEIAYSWIEGYAIQLRGGARRPEIAHQGPVTLGAGLARDNLSLDYAWEQVAGSTGSHRVGVRIR